jgi:hypothetical protein
MSDQLFEHAVHDWLEGGSDQTPPAAIDAVLLAVKTTPQERELRIPRRFTLMPASTRLAATIVLVAILGSGLALYLNQAPGPGTNPTPNPSPSPSAQPSTAGSVIDTGNWISYTSERYGFDIKRPPNWNENPSSRAWNLADAATFPAVGTEDFTYQPAENLGVRVSAWSVAVAPGTSLGTWLESYCVMQGKACPGVLSIALPITMDGHPASSLAGPTEDSRVVALVNDRVYIVTAWRPDNDPSVAEFGGGRKLVEAYVSTMTLRPGGPAPEASPPALTQTFTSGLYGYAIDFPSTFWTATAGTVLWVPGVTPGTDGWSDRFLPPSTINGFRAASAAVPNGVTTPDDPRIQNITDYRAGECGPASSTLGDIVIDGQPGKVRLSCEEIEATVFVGGRIYLFTLFLDTVPPYTIAGGRTLFEAMMGSVQLTPETAEVAGPAAS